MLSKISKTLRGVIASSFIFSGLFVIILGGLVVRLGAWMGDRQVIEVEQDDLTDDQLAQVIREAREAKRDED